MNQKNTNMYRQLFGKKKKKYLVNKAPRYCFKDISWDWLSRECWMDNQYKLYY